MPASEATNRLLMGYLWQLVANSWVYSRWQRHYGGNLDNCADFADGIENTSCRALSDVAAFLMNVSSKRLKQKRCQVPFRSPKRLSEVRRCLRGSKRYLTPFYSFKLTPAWFTLKVK